MNPEENSNSFEFLLIEYERLQQLHFAERKDEEKRVDFFIAITSGVIAGILLLFQSDKIPVQYTIIITEVILFLLFIIGLNTLGRVAIATVQVKAIVKLRENLQKIFAENNINNRNYINGLNENNLSIKNRPTSKLQNSTTMSFLVIIIITFLVGTIFFVPFIYFGINLYCSFGVIIPTMLLIWILLSKYYGTLKKKLKPWKLAF